MNTKSCLWIPLFLAISISVIPLLSARPAETTAGDPGNTLLCYDKVKQFYSERYLWYRWYISPPHFLWNQDPNVGQVRLKEVLYDDRNLIKSVTAVDRAGRTVGIDFSAHGAFARASLHYEGKVQATIEERFYGEERLECSFTYWPDRALDVVLTVKPFSEDTFHVEFRIGGESISGFLAASDPRPEVLRKVHEAGARIGSSASIAALNPVVLEPVACLVSERLERDEISGPKDTKEGMCELATILGDYFGIWGTLITWVVNKVAENVSDK